MTAAAASRAVDQSIGNGLVVQGTGKHALAGEVSRAFLGRRHSDRVGRNSLPDAAALVGGEEECPVFLDGPAKCAPELVLLEIRLFTVQWSGRIQHLVAEKFVHVAMKGIGPGLGHYIDHRAGVASVFRIERVGQHPELFDGIRAGLHRGKIGELVVGVAAVHAEVVGASAAAIHRNHAGVVAAVEEVGTGLRLHARAATAATGKYRGR